MKLAWKYARFYRVRSFVFVGILSLTIALPFISETLSQSLVDSINRRTQSTPVVVSRRAGKIRQSLNALFFVATEQGGTFNYGIFEDVAETDGFAVPLLNKHTTKYAPVVATEIDYFAFRDLTVANGSRFALPGDVVVGSAVAAEHRLKVGDRIKIQSRDLYDITKSTPIDLIVSGILSPSSSPDDSALFTSLKTVWILDGFLHSHSDQDPYKKTHNGETNYSKSLKIKQNVSEKSLLEFHYHSDLKTLPISHVIYRGYTHKSEVLLMDKINQNHQLMAFRPAASINAIVKILLRLETFFATYHLFWSVCTLIMMALVFGLIIQSRVEEFTVLVALGASKNFVWVTLAQLISLYLGLAVSFAALWYFLVRLIWRGYIL